MKNPLLYLTFVATGTVFAQAQSELPVSAQSDAPPATVILAPLTIEPAVPPDDRWATKDNGVIGQFINAPNWLEPINPFAKPESGFGEQNLSTDTTTGRIMGLNLIAFGF